MRKPKKKLPTRKQLQARVTRLEAKATKLYDQREAVYAQAAALDDQLRTVEIDLDTAGFELSDFDLQESGGTPFSAPDFCPLCGR